MKKMKILVMPNMKEVGNQINEELQRKYNTKESFLLKYEINRFSNGEGKLVIKENLNDTTLYILSDVGNYEENYLLHDQIHYMSPDEHFMDIKRGIAATSGNASKINVIMPLLYESRQHKRKGNESLDCAIALQELQNMGVNKIITFDAHDPSICNAIPRLPFENYYPTKMITDKIKEEEIEDILVVSPDMGAMERGKIYAEILNCDVGVCYKRRDLSKVINGKNPIIEHLYLGPSVKGKDILIVDDMIASGSSMLEIAEKLKKEGANKIYFVATFSLFTEGINKFIGAYEKGLFTRLYSTNLSYIPNKLKETPWFYKVNCTECIAEVIK